jgi:hypothetical protein
VEDINLKEDRNMQVTRNGVNQGQNFIEVQHGAGIYAVPTSTLIPVGTEVEISVTVKEVPTAPEALSAGTEVSATAPVVATEGGK